MRAMIAMPRTPTGQTSKAEGEHSLGHSRSLPSSPTWPTNHSPRQSAGVLAVPQDLYTVHENIAHARRILMRLVECRVVLNRFRIEDDDVGVVPRHQSAAIVQLEIVGWKRCQPPDRFLERQNLLVTNVLAEQAS